MNTIEVIGLTKRFGEFTAVNNLNFQVARGEVFGFLGANGAGKSTAMRMLCGLLDPTEGRASVAGYDVYRQRDRVKKSIGYMSQRFSLYEDLTVRENIEFFGSIYGLSPKECRLRMQQMYSSLGLGSEVNSLVSSLSLGWRQKISFSLALIHRPSVVFLDEPTGGVDPIVRRQFWEMISETASSGVTIFVTTHYMDEAEYCDRVSIMVDGEIRVIGAPNEISREHGVDSVDDLFYLLATRGGEKL
ncbi:MAG: ABC transporter ATP-binding protein [Bacteroidales bacterium]